MSISTLGTIKRVDPLRSLADVRKIKDLLKSHPRNFALLVVGVNTALRASDLCKLTREEVRDLAPGDDLCLRMKKTSNRRSRGHIAITVNEDVVAAIQPLLTPGDGPLFVSEKTGKALTEAALCRLVQGWCDSCRIKGRHGSHTLRKSFAWIQLRVFKASEEQISVALGHSSTRETRSYLGIQPEETKLLFMNRIG
jgi:integrase